MWTGTSDRVNSLIFNDPLGLQPTNENEEEDIRIEFTEIDEEENEEEDITEEDISEQVDEILDFFSNIWNSWKVKVLPLSSEKSIENKDWVAI